MKKLQGKIALITGGAQGIGKAIAECFAGEGGNIALCDVNLDGASATAAELSRDGAAVRAYAMNVTDERSVADSVKLIKNDFGKIDILVNNAGITRDSLMIRMRKPDWDNVIAVNLTGAFIVTREVVKGMIMARYGRIVNITSVVGITGNAWQANYSASKAGLIGLTKTMAREFASRSITVNAVAPGYIKTDMTESLKDEVKQAFLAAIPLNKHGTTKDVARVVTFLASDDASYITGQVICVDGGMVM